MDNWKDSPGIFVEGPFNIKCKGLFEDHPPEIEGYDKMNKSFITERINAPIKDCTLIARPISDMSDDEWVDLNNRGYASWNGREYHLLDRAGAYLELTKKGIYPFVKDNNPKDVIWRYENE